MPMPNTLPNPELFFETMNAYQRTAALKSALELDLFTGIAEGNNTYGALARRCGIAERGARVLADAMTILGFLTRNNNEYELTRDSAMFLDRRSPAYIGGSIQFLLSPQAMDIYANFTAAIRKGGAVEEQGSLAPEHPIWVTFARSMAPLMMLPAQMLAKVLGAEAAHKWKVLSLAAGHGMYEITIAKQNPNADVWAVDWAPVLELAKENAAKAGVSDRYHTIPGSALEIDFGTGYDVVLLANFIHHFDPPTVESLLRKVYAALGDGGRIAILEFIPNEDRLTPVRSAWFNVILLATTPAGEAYTFTELRAMLEHAGFKNIQLHDMEPTPFRAVIASK
jgi:ubiquinone/menaquinone biosynthesis C-methylase UbiE